LKRAIFTDEQIIRILQGAENILGVNPESYLPDMLTVIASYPVNQAAELLPWNLQAKQRRLAKELAWGETMITARLRWGQKLAFKRLSRQDN
jgi:hypothetical protein